MKLRRRYVRLREKAHFVRHEVAESGPLSNANRVMAADNRTHGESHVP